MKLYLFKKSFNVSNPLLLIETYCFQNDFYKNYDLLLKAGKRTVNDANKIGAHIKKNEEKLFAHKICCTGRIKILNLNIDDVMTLSRRDKECYLKELFNIFLKEIICEKGIGLTKCTKVLHTLYPEIIPMIDNPLQNEYRRQLKEDEIDWSKDTCDGFSRLLADYYETLNKNINNLKSIKKCLNKQDLGYLNEVRIFDILWWSYLKSKDLANKNNIKWSIIK